MTTIPNLNVVVQQGSTARDTQNIKQHTQDPGQVAAVPQPGKENTKLTTVQTTNESEKLRTDKEKNSEKKEQKKKKKKDDKEESKDALLKDPNSPGGLLDIEV